MHYTIVFAGGPLNGTGLHGDVREDGTPRRYVSDDPFVASDGGVVGKRFTVVNSNPPGDDQLATLRLRRHVYQVQRRETVTDKLLPGLERLLIHVQYVCDLEETGESVR